jgi:hypothetical protein
MLPTIGGITVLLAYSLIIYKRFQKQSYITKEFDEDKRKVVEERLADNSEFLWWMLVSAVIFLAFFGFLLIFVARYHILSFADVVMYGVAIWALVAYAGYKITKPKL